MCEKKIIWNASTCTCENGKYSGSIIRDSVVTCDKVIEVSKIIPTKTNPTKLYQIFSCVKFLAPLNLIINKINGYIEESNENKYLKLVPTAESKDMLNKYEELWCKIRDLIKSLTYNSDNYDEKYIKIKFNSDDDLPLKKRL